MIGDPFAQLLQLAESAAREIQALPVCDVVTEAASPVEEAADQAPTPESQQVGAAQVTLSLSDELMFAFMHWQLNGDWPAMEAAIDCKKTLECLKQLWDELIACKARAGPLLETYVAAAVRGRPLGHAFSLAVSCLSSLERSKLLATSKPAERRALQQVLAEVESLAAGQQGSASCAPALRSALVASCARLRPGPPTTKLPYFRSHAASPQELSHEAEHQFQAPPLEDQHAPATAGAAMSSHGAVAVSTAMQGLTQAGTHDALAFPQASVQHHLEVDLAGCLPAALDAAPHRRTTAPWSQRLHELLQQQQLQATTWEGAGLQSTSGNGDMEALQQHQVQSSSMQYGSAIVTDHSQSLSSDQPVVSDATAAAVAYNRAARHARLSEDAQTHQAPAVPRLNFTKNNQSHHPQQQQYEKMPSFDVTSLLHRLAVSSGGVQEMLQLVPQLPPKLKQELVWQLQHERSKNSHTAQQHQGSASAPSGGLAAGSAADHPFKAAAILQSGYPDVSGTAPTHVPSLQPRLELPPAELVLQLLQPSHRGSSSGAPDPGGALPAGIPSATTHQWMSDSRAPSSEKQQQNNLPGPDQVSGSMPETVRSYPSTWTAVTPCGNDMSSDRRSVPTRDSHAGNAQGQQPGLDPDLSESRPLKRRAMTKEQTAADDVSEVEGSRPQRI